MRIRDPGWEKILIWDPGWFIPDPQHWLLTELPYIYLIISTTLDLIFPVLRNHSFPGFKRVRYPVLYCFQIKEK